MSAGSPKYKLLGSDQKEYGPVSVDQFRTWIAQGRANAHSKVQAAGSRGWKPLTEFPEFADALERAGARKAAADRSKGKEVTPHPKRCGLALTSLVLGCLGSLTFGVTSLVGLVLGIVALVRINKSQGQLGGRGLALAGIVVSAILMLLVPLLTAMTLPALVKYKGGPARLPCVNNVAQLNVALILYASDRKGEFPDATNWCDVVIPYLGGMTNAFVCPQGEPGPGCHYALNAQLAGRRMNEVQDPARTVLVFECDGGWNVSGGREGLPAKPRRSGACTIGFADGHVQLVKTNRVADLCWEP